MTTNRKTHGELRELQKVFDRAHARFFKDGVALEEFPDAERIAFVTMVFDGEVLCNSFQFWITNDQCISNEELLAVLDRLEVRRCAYVRRLVKEASAIAQEAARLERRDAPDEEFDTLADRCSMMDDAYGTIRNEFMADVEAHVLKLLGGEAPPRARKAG